MKISPCHLEDDLARVKGDALYASAIHCSNSSCRWSTESEEDLGGQE